MGTPARRTGRWSLPSGRPPILLLVGLGCMAAILIEVGAVSGFFGWVIDRSGGGGASLPDLNPYHEQILAIPASTTYLGPLHGYFPTIDGTNLCGTRCPELPREWPGDGILPPEIAVYFYFNVTNTASVDQNLSVPVIATSGPDPTLFLLLTFCCYTHGDTSYDEVVDSPILAPPGLPFGLEGYAYTTVPLPSVPGGGYTLYVNFTAD